MGINAAMRGDRVQIALFGRTNAGKSSVINAITGQETAITSEVKGTTTDPVSKAMEILPLGPCMLIDTPGIDDKGELGEKRVERTMKVLNRTDIALLVVNVADLAQEETERQTVDGILPEEKPFLPALSDEEQDLLRLLSERKIPYVIVLNQSDRVSEERAEAIRRQVSSQHSGQTVVLVSAATMYGIDALKECMVRLLPDQGKDLKLIGDLVERGDFVVLVVPIDSAAPKGRLIMPQQQVIRDLLDHQAVAIVAQVAELGDVLSNLDGRVRMVVTDSQAFQEVAKIVPGNIPLTSFSILFARHKGNLQSLVEGVTAVERLRDGDTVLIAEGCTHHRQCDDIGTVKIPRWLREYTGKAIQIESCSGQDFPADLSKYAMIIHCGGCTLTEREMKYRIFCAGEQKIPIVNYGIFIAFVNGILKRSVELFPAIHKLL